MLTWEQKQLAAVAVGVDNSAVNHATSQENTADGQAETRFNHQKPEERQPVTQNNPEQTCCRLASRHGVQLEE